MKTLRLLKLTSQNFKGANLDFEPDGHNADLIGKNETRKTTHLDAIWWLFFGKDSQNKPDSGKGAFEIKTLDKDGNILQHHLDHEVYGKFLLDDEEFELKRVFSETWSGKKGAAKTHTGHTTKYWVNGVPQKIKADYNAFIASIIDEETFKLLTDVRYFNEHLKWPARRSILEKAFLSDELTDTEVANTAYPSVKDKQKHMDLVALLNKRPIDDHRKIIKARMKVIDEEKPKIATRIDEKLRDLPDVSDLSKVALEKTAERLTIAIKEKEAEKARVENGGQVAELQKKLRHLEADHIDRQNEAQKKTNEQVQDLQKKMSGLNQQSDDLHNQIISFDKQIKLNDASLIQKSKEREYLLEQYRAIKSEQMICPAVTETCPTCKQNLPEDQIKAAIDKVVSDFNVKQAEDLAENKKNGMATAADIKQLQNDNDAFLVQIEGLKADKEKIDGQIQTLKAGIQKLESLRPESTDTTPEIVNLKAEIEKLQNGAISTSAIDEEIKKLEISRDSNADLLADIQKNTDAAVRVKELEAEEKTMAKEYEKLLEELSLTDDFIKAKVSILSSKIDDQFRITKFKMFKIQVNGDLDNNMCESMVNGVPYASNLNNGGRVKCGADIINTLSRVYDFSVVLFVDNAESVTDMLPMDTQVVRLVVDEKQKKLKIKYYEPKTAESKAA